MPSLFSTDEFGAPRAAHGADASRQVSASSSFAPQGLRTEEALALARQVDGQIDTLKSLRGHFMRLAGNSSSNYDTSTTIGAINHVLKKARVQVSKAEAVEDAEGDDTEDSVSAIETATKLLARAKKMIAVAIEDEDEDTSEDQIEAAKAACAKVSKRLSALKAKPAAVTATTTGAVTTETVAELDKATNVLKAQLNEVIEMLGQRSRSAGAPPNFSVAKASNDAEPSLHAQIAHLRDIGSIDANTAISAKSLASRVALAKSGQGSLDEVREMVSRASSEVIRNLFAGV